MNIFLYDGTFEGFLSAVFYAYARKVFPNKICGNNLFQKDMFAEEFTVYTNTEYAQRVWNGIEKKASKFICQKVFRVFLSEMADVEMLLFDYIKLTFGSRFSIDEDYSNSTVLEFNNIYKKVTREAQKVVMFVRFQKTADDIYFAPFDPAYNVLSLTINHFKERFADQQWVIYDTRRNYGFYYNLHDVEEVRISDSNINFFTGKVNKDAMDDSELNFQEIWNCYYQSTTIKERKNLKLHKQFLPKRFWKYLPEKNFLEYR